VSNSISLNLLESIRQKKKTSISLEDRFAVGKFARDLATRLHQNKNCAKSTKILLCIGTDRSTGDSLGPLVGTMATKSGLQSFYQVYGTLEKPVHAANLTDTLLEIKKTYHRPLIIAIDASLGKSEHVGYVNVGDGSLRPGAGVKKDLPPVGQIYITGIVNIAGFMEYLVLQNTRLNLVMSLADLIAKGLSRSVVEFRKLQGEG
jgi:putative sporulation protein YyaC